MVMKRQRLRHWPAVLAIGLWFVSGARAEEPAPAPPGERARKEVRNVGGDRGAKLDVKRQGPAPENLPPGLRQRMEKLRAIRAAPVGEAGSERVGTEPAGAQQDEAQGGVEQTPEQRAQRRLERSKRARHVYWRTMMKHLKRPSDIPPDVRGELQRHARRLARLQRIQELAQQKGDQKTLDRVAALITREHERHGRKMHAPFGALDAEKAAAPAAEVKPAAAAEAEPEPADEDPDPEATAADEEEEGEEP